MVQIHPTQLLVEDRARGVRAWADGIPSTEAAVEVLIGHGHWLDDEDFLRSATCCPEVADGEYVTVASVVEVDWARAATFAAAPPLASATDVAMLRLAIGIASRHQLVNLSDELTGLKESNVRLVLTAIAHSAGWPEEGVAALIDGRF